MNVLFLSIGRFDSINQHAIYPDLLREFKNQGHNVYVVSRRERRTGLPTELIEEDGAKLLKVRVGNITKTNIIEKGISTVLIESQYKSAIKKYFSNVKFDMVMYSTPPITFASVVKYIKKRDNAKSYLLLKDIFPQNAVDMGMMSKSGWKSIIYKYFRRKEKMLYALSDKIGCMSQANVDFVLKHNPEIAEDRVEVSPNCVEVMDMSISQEKREELRKKYNIPLNKKVFVYGGSLGKPQGIPFVVDCLRAQKDNAEAFFLIVGSGTQYKLIEQFVNEEKPENVLLMESLPKDEYDAMVACCDVGLIFLDHRFTIPNFPSRLLAYMQAGLPVLACTDPNTDIGKVITDGGFGWWCESNSVDDFSACVEKALNADFTEMTEKEKKYLAENYSVERVYKDIV